jgi:SBP domain
MGDRPPALLGAAFLTRDDGTRGTCAAQDMSGPHASASGHSWRRDGPAVRQTKSTLLSPLRFTSRPRSRTRSWPRVLCRWCHKCSRLHELSAFTQGRRTCAKVLKNLVARRRHASEAQGASPAYEAATAHLSPRQLAARQRHRQQAVQQMAQPHAFYGGLMPGLLYPHIHPAGAPHMHATSMQAHALLSSVLSMAPQLAGAWMQQALISGGQQPPPPPQPQLQPPSGTQQPDLTRILGDLLAAQTQSSAARGAGAGSPAQQHLGVMSLTGLPFAMAAPSMLYAQPAQMMPPPRQPQQQQGDLMQGLQQIIQQSQQQFAQAQSAASAQAAAASGAGAAAPAPGGGGAVASVLPDSLLRSLMGITAQATNNPPP